ncbi:MAG: radical SAM protein [Termitinemataceae bacterium]|nr:MAG: radical SAM protein [Termitinemataceae bacterium]
MLGLENECVIEECFLKQNASEKIAALQKHNPLIIGISVSIWNHTDTLSILRAAYPPGGSAQKPIIIMGGPEVQHLPCDSLLLSFADYVIKGEGENQFRELCAKLLSVSTTPTLVHNTASYHLYTTEDLQKKLTYVEASRGCPYSCAFCLSGLDNGKVFEFPLGDFFAQMETLIARGARRFKFLDRTFNYNIDRSISIMEFFLERLRQGMFVHFEMVPSRITKELLSVMRHFPQGSLRLEIGVQTLNPKTAAAIHRAIDPQRDLELLHRITVETNAIVHADLIAGLPCEETDSFAAGFNRLYAAGPGEIQLGILKCLPGTMIAKEAADYGILYNAEVPPYEVYQTDALPAEDLKRIKNFARFWELIVNRNAFTDIVPSILGNSPFENFMELSNHLLNHFGRNWALDRSVLRAEIMGLNKLLYNKLE